MASVKFLIDGQATTLLPADDRGLQYGDGLFETCVLRHGRIELWQQHLDRLIAGCQRLAIPTPDPAQLSTELRSLCVGTSDGLVKLIITRGSGGRGYRPPAAPSPRRIWQLHPIPAYPTEYATEGVRLQRCRTQLSQSPQLAGIKHLNRLEQVLARAEWSDPDIPEGLLQDSAGNWIEGTMSNLFVVSDGRLLTPDLSRCGVAGVMRDQVLALAAEQGIASHIAAIDTATLTAADELFISNSVMRIWPVRELGEWPCRPGALTRSLASALAERLDISAQLIDGLADSGQN